MICVILIQNQIFELKNMSNNQQDQYQISSQRKPVPKVGQQNFDLTRYHKSKNNSKSSIFKIAFNVLVALIILILIFKIHSLQISIDLITKGTPLTKTDNQGGAVSNNIASDLESRIRQLQVSVSRLESWKNSLGGKQAVIINPKKSQINIAEASSKQLTEYIQKEFQNHKTTINFLHMHAAQQFFYNKVNFLKSVLGSDLLRSYEKAQTSFLLALNNYKIPHPNIHIEKEIKDLINKEYNRLSREYDFTLKELPFCIVVPSLNNAKEFRYQYNLQSMWNLDYKNFKIVIMDDASTDHNYDLIKQFIQENPSDIKISVATNKERMTAVPNIHRAVTEFCDKDDIVVLADGDDELLGRNILKVYNHVYQKQNVDVVYSNHLQFYQHTKQVYRGWSMSYSDEEKKNNRYRDVPQKIAHLRSFKAKLYLAIKVQDLKDEKGEWLKSTYDQVICLPILEMSCGRIAYLEEFFYLYNFGIGTNDLQVDGGLQKSIADYVKYKKPKYQCLNS